MAARNLTLGIFVALTVVFASLAASEYVEINSPKSETPPIGTLTSSSVCTATGGIGCPHFFNNSYAISVSYGGPWGLSYQGYLGDSEIGQLVKSGSFYGHGQGNTSVLVAGTSEVGTLLCAEAQKLDASNATLVLTLASGATNQTSTAYGTTKVCLAHVVV